MQHKAIKDYVTRNERVGDKIAKKKEKNPWHMVWTIYFVCLVSAYSVYFFSNGLVIQ